MFNNPYITTLINYLLQFSGLTAALPEKVQILTLEPWKGMSYLIRFEHLMDPYQTVVNKPVKISLAGLFTTFNVTSVQEVSLGGNQWLSDKIEFNTNKEPKNTGNIRYRWNSDGSGMEDMYVIIYPRQILSFVIDIR